MTPRRGAVRGYARLPQFRTSKLHVTRSERCTPSHVNSPYDPRHKDIRARAVRTADSSSQLNNRRNSRITRHDDRSYSRPTVAETEVRPSIARCARLDDISGPRKSPGALAIAKTLSAIIEPTDSMADILRDNDRSIPPEERRQTPWSRR